MPRPRTCKIRRVQRRRERHARHDIADPRVRQGCSRKNQYLTKKQAREGARLIGMKHNKELSHYKCQYCPGFHLTRKVAEPAPVAIEITFPTLLSLVGTIVKPMVRRIA